MQKIFVKHLFKLYRQKFSRLCLSQTYTSLDVTHWKDMRVSLTSGTKEIKEDGEWRTGAD